VIRIVDVKDKYFWALTTSSLQTLSERIGDLLSSKQIEIEDIYTNRGALFNIV